MKKKLALILIALVMALTPACSAQDPDKTTGGANNNGQNEQAGVQGTDGEEATAPQDVLAQYDFGGQEIRILTSINATDGSITNSNYMIEGAGEITGDSVDDAVYKRNMDVENLLNVKFKYTQIDEDYNTIESAVSKLILSGTDEYDLIINDLRSLANLSLQGMFQNIKNTNVFDLSQTYWYNNFMEDVSIGKEKSFLLAGDYFADVLRNCHALFLNKSMLDEQTPGKSDELYKTILDGNWTFDEFLSLSKSFLKDVDGSGKYDKKDQYGFICVGTWGSAIPFMMAADTDVFTKNADGIPELTINNDKSMQLHDYLTTLFTTDSGGSSKFDAGELISQFQNRRSLMVGFQRLSTLQNLRDMVDEVSILPYPKLNAQQTRYITSAHDTIEIGAIPGTTLNFDMTCVVLEALNRETKKTVIPVYYEEALKIKYARDEVSAQIIDLIHDGMDNVFPLAYSQSINELLSLYDVGATKNFVSGYEKVEEKLRQRLDTVVSAFTES